MSLCHTVVTTPMGQVILAADGQHLAGIWFEGQAHAPDMSGWRRDDANPLLLRARDQVLAYLRGELRDFDLPLSPRGGTPFMREVWQQVSRIPRGQVCSYADIARALGRPQASRAVGAAVGRNPWLMLVPCHRVVGQGGRLTGYAAGLERKAKLLRMEGALH
jgi:methylated-DNA-[protein]-cysteine S-methyltransferase